jgi:hypothetical protein
MLYSHVLQVRPKRARQNAMHAHAAHAYVIHTRAVNTLARTVRFLCENSDMPTGTTV